MADHHEEEKKRDFLDTAFDYTVGGGAIVYVSICLALILTVLIFG